MISRVLVPMDDSEMAKHALEYVLENHPNAKITVLHIVGKPSRMGGTATGLALEGDINEAAQESAENVFNQARRIAEQYDIDIDTEVQLGHPARVILNQASEFDTIVIGSHSGSLTDRLFVGNIAKKVAHQSPVPVTVVR